MITQKDIQKGDLIVLRDTGWKATILDNYKTRNIRLAEVDGIFKEVGSIYASNIHSVKRDGEWKPVNYQEA